MFAGRVVNVATIWGTTAKEPRARGWHYVLLKDDGGVVSVCFYAPFFSFSPLGFLFCLG